MSENKSKNAENTEDALFCAISETTEYIHTVEATVQKLSDQYIDKILFYCATSFSLVFTVINFALTNDSTKFALKHILTLESNFINISVPNIFLAYLAMGILVLCSSFCFLHKKLLPFGYLKSATPIIEDKLLKHIIKLQNNTGNSILLSLKNDPKLSIKKLYSTIIDRAASKKHSPYSLRMSFILIAVIESLAITAAIFLFIFCIEVSQALVWK